MNKKGIALIFILLVIIVLSVTAGALVSRSVNEGNLVLRYKESTEAFWLAEAGINRSLDELRMNFSSSGSNLWRTPLGNGGYYVDVVQIDAEKRRVTSHGFMPYTGTARVERLVEAILKKEIPEDFFGNAIYSAGEVDLNGNAYSVTGNIMYADEIEYSSDNINGNVSQDISISPLAKLNYQELLEMSQFQGNVYIEQNNEYVRESTGVAGFPSSFWYSEPTDPADPTTGTPNVVYVEADLVLNGDIGTIGGFFVVVGDVISNPSSSYDTTMNGNGSVEGCIYTRGEFRINGGGNGLNVNGGVWAGEVAVLNGSANVSYDADYMRAIEAIVIPDVQIISWRDKQNPYQVPSP